MHPDVGKPLLAGKCTALGNLILMMRKDQVYPAGMNVEHIPLPAIIKQLKRHGRALEVPSGPAPAERRIPGRANGLIFRPGGLPENTVPRVFLGIFVGRTPLAGSALQFTAGYPRTEERS